MGKVTKVENGWEKLLKVIIVGKSGKKSEKLTKVGKKLTKAGKSWKKLTKVGKSRTSWEKLQ